jgi:hypothetical protein
MNGIVSATRDQHEQYGEAPGQAVIARPVLRQASEPLSRHTPTLPVLPGLLVLDLGRFFARCRSCSWVSGSCATVGEALSAVAAHGCTGVNKLGALCLRP